MHFQDGSSTKRYKGTGWVIDSSTIVTAAHDLCDPKKDLGDNLHAIAIRASIGLKGNPAETRPKMERRRGRCAAVHWAWYAHMKEQNDFAIIKLEKPFQDVQPMAWKDTPSSAQKSRCRVVGYPVDLPKNNKRATTCHMYESEDDKFAYDLIADDYTLKYSLDTFGGKSILARFLFIA